MKRFMIAGTKSGSGKTTVTCALLAALKARDIKTASFKCGPDYIDPMFHREMIGTSTHNLDSFFCDDDMIRHLLKKGSKNADISVIEGVMGFYDGTVGSSYSISRITQTPAVIVIDCKGMSDSIGAVMQGFLNYRKPNNIIGFIFDRLPEKLTDLAKKLCEEMNTGYFGFLPGCSHTVESRRLGLVTAAEIEDIQEKLGLLGKLAEENILIDKLLDINAAKLCDSEKINLPFFASHPQIAVSADKAFCFRYAENIELLEEMGCEINYFSPLEDRCLPPADGLILCGGYPELYAEKLSQNTSMLSDIKEKITDGMPVIAECGGFMYLHEKLRTEENEYHMVGALEKTVFSTDKLQRFGYINMCAEKDGLLLKKGEEIKAHEFHYWDSEANGCDFHAVKPDGREWHCGHSTKTSYMGFPHLYFYANINAAANFVTACADYGEQNGKNKENSLKR